MRTHKLIIPIINSLISFLMIFFTISCKDSGNITQTGYNEIQSGFTAPSDSNTVWCYWYWINDDISKEGITKDLETMKEVGIGAAFIGNINPPEVNGRVPLFSDYWWECMVHAVNEGKRIGVDIGSFNCPGWSQSGGPWVKPEMAMRHLVYSETTVKGPGQIQVKLTKPAKLFEDIYVLAFPSVKTEKIKLSNTNAQVTSLPNIVNISNLLDGDTATVAVFDTNEGDYTIDIKSDKVITARSIQLFPGKQRIKCDCELYAYVDEKYTLVKSFEFDRSNLNVNVGPDVFAPVSIALNDISSGTFRLIARNRGSWNTNSGFSEIVISEAPVLEKYVEKKMGKMFPTPQPKWDSYMWENQKSIASGKLKVTTANVVDISDKMDSSGLLNWDVPDGEWTVVRYGMTPTGTKNSPSAPQGKGFEIDKASEKIARYHFENYMGELSKRVPEENRSALKYTIADSYEMGSQNWTDNFEQKFKERYGYSARLFLPVFTGRIVNSVEESNRFLWDLRRFVADAVAYEYVGGLRKISNENNLKLWLENYGHWGFPSEFLIYGGQSNLVSGEYWNEGTLGNIECKSASSAAHIYGKPITSAEAFTASGKAFLRHPALLKKRGDWSFTEGINHFVLHVYIHQPDEKRVPGVNAWFSTEFNRHNTWFGQSKIWIDYLRRCQHLLQQGKYVADVCYFIGEDAPMMTGAKNPELPAGYSYDYINAEVILNRLSVEDGKFVLPDGMSYRVMVLPPLKTMRPELLKKIESLVQQGGVVFGQAPENSPSLENFPECDKQVKTIAERLWGVEKDLNTNMKKVGRGYIVDDLDLKTTLETLHISADVALGDDSEVLWTHRTLPGMEIYFLTNQSDEEINITPGFRVSGMKPQLWDAVTGEIRELTQFSEKNGRTEIPLNMHKDQSWFIVFSNHDVNNGNVYQENFPDFQLVKTINNQWSIAFQNKDIGPDATVVFDNLKDWSTSDNEEIKYYSGTAVYKTTFELTEVPYDKGLYLNLGDVRVMAKVKLNGEDIGGVWMAPFRLKATDYLQEGTNEVEIEVVNLWRNRLIKDKNLPVEQRYTWHLVDDIREDEELQPSGLLGPVTIESIDL